jgi:hypothetical protein
MTTIFSGEHLSLDEPVCALCGSARPLVDCLSANLVIAAVGVICIDCDAVTMLRYVLDPFPARV